MRARARAAADALRSSITGRAAHLPEWLWVPASSGGAILAVGLVAHAVGQPLLFASLGPTVFMHVHKPWHEAARFYNTAVGHGVAIVAAAAAVVVTGAAGAPAVLSSEHVPMARVASAVIATAGTALLQVLSGAAHPPAASTTLLIALGGFAPTARDMADVALGVLVIAVLGVPLRRLRLTPEEVSRRVDKPPDSA